MYADAAHSKPIVQYAYNDQGYQVLKKHYNEQGQAEKDTWYARDAAGNVLSIYEEDMAAKQSLSPVEFPVYAQGRLGMMSTRGNDEVYQYELSDHVGNVRAVISRQRQADGSIDVLYTRDYYSFGSVIEDNERNKGSYRFGYQGQYSEEDEKTSWHSFELRQYDSDIGRWNSIDPYGQYHSPYVAMGNAPNMMIDADGGWSMGTALAITAGSGLAGYGIDRALGGDGSKGLILGLSAGAVVGNLGYADDWRLPDLSGSRKALTPVNIARATGIMGAATRAVSNSNRIPAASLPRSEISTLEYNPPQPTVLNSPVGNAPIISPFGANRPVGTSPHRGTDYGVPVGTPVQATAQGTVIRVRNDPTGYGQYIVIDHGAAGNGNVYTLYAHGSQTLVAQGAQVNVGQVIMNSGNTGFTTGPHLHYEVIRTNITPLTWPFFNNFDIRYGANELQNLLLGH